jgi:hypothetical protein
MFILLCRAKRTIRGVLFKRLNAELLCYREMGHVWARVASHAADEGPVILTVTATLSPRSYGVIRTWQADMRFFA